MLAQKGNQSNVSYQISTKWKYGETAGQSNVSQVTPIICGDGRNKKFLKICKSGFTQ